MNIAIYCRISVDDGGGSIENQLKLAYKYIEDNKLEMKNYGQDMHEINNRRINESEYFGKIESMDNNEIEVKEYIDRGESGSNMERKGIQDLIANLNNIDMVLVKDISRLGRNYIEVGGLLNIFNENNVRLIAINKELDYELNSLLADFYSKDISIKTKSVLDMNKKKGMYSLPKVPYGYRKSSKDKYSIEIYEPEARYVRFIYKKYEEGYKIGEIVQMLNSYNEKICGKIDVDYNMEKNNNLRVLKQGNIWNYHKVYRILHNEFYQGTMVYGKSEGHAWQGRKREYKDNFEWIRIYNHHDSII